MADDLLFTALFRLLVLNPEMTVAEALELAKRG